MTKFLLLLKRNLIKKSYIIMLAIMPLMVMLLSIISQGDSTILKVGVCFEGDGTVQQELREDLQANPGSISYEFYNDEQALIDQIKTAKLNQGWIIPTSIEESTDQLAMNQTPDTKIQILVREDGLSAMLGKEIVCSRIYKIVSKKILQNYLISKGISATPEMIDAYFSEINIPDSIFEMGYVDGTEVNDTDILLMPMRGILSLAILLIGIASSMYYLQDERKGIFLWWKTDYIFVRDVEYYFSIMLIPAAIFLACVFVTGVATNPHREILSLLLYVWNVIMFSILLRLILKTVRNVSITMPAIIMASAILSPVFIDLKMAGRIRMLIPTYYYLSSITDGYYLKSSLVYAIFLGGLCVFLLKLSVKMGQVFKTNLL